MADRINVYCPACKHRGKARTRDGATYTDDEIGVCTRCGAARVPGVPPKGGTVGRPRITVADKLRRKAAELVAIADELDSAK